MQSAEEALRVANLELAARNEALVREADERERRLRAESAQAEAEEQNAAKDRFLAMLSHELRTPLSPILHAVALLEESEDPLAVRECIDTIRRNVRLEARLIDDLLDPARIRDGKLRLDTHPVDVHEGLRHAVEICRPELEARHARVEVKLDAPNGHVRGDSTRLQEVFWNLLTNAAKFSPENSTIQIGTSAEDGGIHVEIADQGVEILQKSWNESLTPSSRARAASRVASDSA